MQIKFLRDRRHIRAGSIRDWPDGAANVLIRRGYAEEVQPEPSKKQQRKRR